MHTDKETIDTGRRQMISEVSYRRLTGELRPDGQTVCDVIPCQSLAICIVGCGAGHPSCEKHAQMADHISPLPAFWVADE